MDDWGVLLIMACYLFTFHAYRSWMPDRKEGFVRRGEGILPADDERADQYNRKATEGAVLFVAEHQQCLIDAVVQSCHHTESRCHGVATDATHVHILMSWQQDVLWKKKSVSVKTSLTRALNGKFGRRTWFSENGSRKWVRDRLHFDHLMRNYLPSHGGLLWFEG